MLFLMICVCVLKHVIMYVLIPKQINYNTINYSCYKPTTLDTMGVVPWWCRAGGCRRCPPAAGQSAGSVC